MIRETTMPIPLRSSAFSVLAACTQAAPLAMLPFAEQLIDACLSLLSLESRPVWRSKPPQTAPATRRDDEADSDDEEAEPARSKRGGPRYEETPQPSTTDPKHPSLRRGAILFLALVFRSANQQQSTTAPLEGSLRLGGIRMPGATLARASTVNVQLVDRAWTVLRYVSETDEDGLVRFQAKEALSEIEM